METLFVFIVATMLHTATMLEVRELQDRVIALEHNNIIHVDNKIEVIQGR